MNIWDRKEFEQNSDTTLTLMNVGDEVEFEIEDNQYVDQLVWVHMTEAQVDGVMEFLQEWKNARAKVDQAGQSTE